MIASFVMALSQGLQRGHAGDAELGAQQRSSGIPHMPCTPAPGGVAAEHRYTLGTVCARTNRSDCGRAGADRDVTADVAGRCGRPSARRARRGPPPNITEGGETARGRWLYPGRVERGPGRHVGIGPGTAGFLSMRPGSATCGHAAKHHRPVGVASRRDFTCLAARAIWSRVPLSGGSQPAAAADPTTDLVVEHESNFGDASAKSIWRNALHTDVEVADKPAAGRWVRCRRR